MHRLIIPALAMFAVTVVPAVSGAEVAQVDGRFDVGGRSIRLSCSGSGSPTVLMDAGFGTAPVEDQGWQRIAAKIAPVTRVCLHDRAGLGGSDPAPAGSRTSLDAATDLRAALRKAQVDGPYLVVGHSIGGLHAQVFASRYSDEVAGLVLVSSTHADQETIWLALLPPAASGEETALTETRALLKDRIENPAANKERLDFNLSGAQARGLKSLGAKPVVIATHSPRYRMVHGLSEPLAIELEAATQKMQKQWLSLSSNAKQNIAATAGHGLPHEVPSFVVDNVLEGVALVRSNPQAINSR